ncbi:MAG: hypothetical protein K2M06_08085 [Muribaculaceae bacterium]|nr:hypothetical protein [Muribaculaceae bacterium]
MSILRKYAYPLCETGVLAAWLGLAGWLCPHAGVATALILAGVWVCVRVAAHCLGLCTKAEKRVLLCAMGLLGALLIVNLDFFMGHPGAHGGQPYLANFDASLNWGYILGILENGSVPPYNFSNYSWIMAPAAAVGGLRSVLAVNSLCVMLAICFCGRIARECCRVQGAAVSAAAMLMLTFAFNFISLGTVLLKDAVVAMAFSGAATALLILRQTDRSALRPMLWAAAACLLSIWVRPRSGSMLVVLILIFVPWKDFAGGKRWAVVRRFLPLALLCMAALVVENTLLTMGITDLIKEDIQPNRALVFTSSPRGSTLAPLIDSYPTMPIWERILLLPFSMALQLLLPLPWTYLRHFDYGPTMMLSHLGYPLYLEAGAVLYFFVFCLRKAPAKLALVSCAGMLFYIITAYTYGGTVSRYAQMLLPLLLPAGAWVLVNCRGKRSLRLWMCAYVLLLALALGAGMYLYNLNPGGNDIRC